MARHHRNSVHRQTGWREQRDDEPAQMCPTTGKRMYGSEEEARATATHQMKTQRGAPQLRVYLCLYCDAWHLTSKGS